MGQYIIKVELQQRLTMLQQAGASLLQEAVAADTTLCNLLAACQLSTVKAVRITA
jgi:hypothetical protein